MFLNTNTLSSYHVVDSNSLGVGLLLDRFQADNRVSADVRDALKLDGQHEQFDIVYSVGLIEHFSEADTQKCISAHFKLCRPGGVVLMTFPTPTALYKLIRSAADSLGMWRFPDERPLAFDEVEKTCKLDGDACHRSVNWWIGLTQGYVVYQKSSS